MSTNLERQLAAAKKAKSEIIWPNHPQLNATTAFDPTEYAVPYQILAKVRTRGWWFWRREVVEWYVETEFSTIGPFETQQEAAIAVRQYTNFIDLGGGRALMEALPSGIGRLDP